ncbi:hypothetical protein [Rhodococcus koreensis]|uniref:hypothetical protein n=1 Tax=Rhodococcus koreensis TaxID=99653 RepID=UPI00197EC417|nr:hypothetical protein [Rhodococcus koreensis]QSE86557.1 hypothetical protein JWS14_42135 [Rhodococcus koreensis]
MTTWTLWLGARLVVGGSTAQIKHQAGVARALWVLACSPSRPRRHPGLPRPKAGSPPTGG